MAKKAKQKKASKKRQNMNEPDSLFFLKVIVFFLLGTMWVRIVGPEGNEISLPVGLIVGLLIARHEHFQIDRKIEFVVLFISTIISFYLPIGLLV